MSTVSIENFKETIPFYNELSLLEKKLGCEIFIVGGAVRDILMGKVPKDMDITAEKTSYEKAAETLGKIIKAYPVPFKDNMRLAKKGGIAIDVSKLRGASITEDLKLRDFTINNLALSLKGELLGDDTDIKSGIIRAASDGAFISDPIRILRGFRFVSSLGFDIDKDTLSLMIAEKELLKNAARERILGEIHKILSGRYIEKAVRLLDEYEILSVFSDKRFYDTEALLRGIRHTNDFALLLSLWIKDDDFIKYLGITNKEMKDIKAYRSIGYEELAGNGITEIKKLAFENKNIIENTAIFIKTNFRDEVMAEKLIHAFKSLDFKESSLINGSVLTSMGYTPSPVFSEIIKDVSFKLASGELDKNSMRGYIESRWEKTDSKPFIIAAAIAGDTKSRRENI